MPKTLVTGASGFIGRHVVPLLLEGGHDVRCLVRPNSDCRFLRQFPVEFIYGDVTDADSLSNAVESVQFVFHLAGVAQVVSNRRFFELHTQGTAHLAEACLKQPNPPRLIHVSSLAAVGPARDKKPVQESTFPKPVSPYGRSKLLAERELCARADRLSCSIVRPPYVFGEWDHASTPLFQMIYKQRIHISPGYFNSLYSFVHATDLAHLLIKVAEEGETLTSNSVPISAEDRQAVSGQGIYNASAGEMVTFGDFGRLIGKAFGHDSIRVFKIPPLACIGTGLFYETLKKITGKTVPLDWNKICEALRGPWICDDDKTKNQLGVTPLKPFQERIEQTAKWQMKKVRGGF